MKRRLTIVGAGPAGTVLATYLGRAGHRVTVYESRPDLRKVDIDAGRSINLALATRGIVVLEELGLMDAVAPLLIPMRGRMIHDQEGNESLQPYGSRPDEVIHSVGRNELNAVLLDDPDWRDDLLESLHDAGLLSRPVWTPLHRLSMYRDCLRGPLDVTEDLAARLINLPSSPRLADG